MASYSWSDIQKEINKPTTNKMSIDTTKNSVTFSLKPKLAFLNVTGTMPNTPNKDTIYKGKVEFFDGYGNYLVCYAKMNTQGNSSVNFSKKNVAFDFYSDSTYASDKELDFTFGDWASYNSFHMKANYTDYMQANNSVAYKIWHKIEATKTSRPWNKDNKSKKRPFSCPDSFQVIIFNNGTFKGLYAWAIKKHRKNYGLTKDSKYNIHVDGNIGYTQSFFKGNLYFSTMEIRNPNNLVTTDGVTSCGENQTPYHGAGTTVQQQTSTFVYNQIQKLSNGTAKVNKESLIDYYIFSMFLNNYDGWNSNWQWVSYQDGTNDSVVWYLLPYDIDGSFGQYNVNTFPIMEPEISDTLTVGRSTNGTAYISASMRWYLRNSCWVYYNKANITSADIQNRFNTIKSALSVNNVIKEYYRWFSNVGNEFHEQESNKNRGILRKNIVSDGWRKMDTFVNNSKGYYQMPTTNSSSFSKNSIYVSPYNTGIWTQGGNQFSVFMNNGATSKPLLNGQSVDVNSESVRNHSSINRVIYWYATRYKICSDVINTWTVLT